MSALRSDDTIAAIATPPGTGGVGIVRVSGPSALAIVGRVVGRDPDRLEDRRLVHAVARDGQGHRLDEVLVVAMRAPRSFTGEDVAELHGHGGASNMQALLRLVVESGARVAEPGEFTRRAFERGRLDLTQAEALLAVIEAGSERSTRAAQALLAGELSRGIESTRERVVTLLAEIEAVIDFPEEDVGALDAASIRSRARAAADWLGERVATFSTGKAVRHGITVALRGPVNAGKSSLFNALIGRDRALVDEQPGTTRDYVEATVEWSGISVLLIDTAGERLAGDGVESRGIERGRSRASEADLELWLVAPGESRPAGAPRQLVVASKSDLRSGIAEVDLEVSAKTGAGLDALKAEILARVGVRSEGADGLLVTTERQRSGLAAAAGALDRLARDRHQPLEVMAIELRTAEQALAEVLGREIDDEVLDELFARFCIGK